jgi:NADH dehydrogenase [ubiquinone] 1 alpha subcomplex assembly factor 7
MNTPLLDKIKTLIAAHGPMPVDEYMALALSDPEHGYYRTARPIGREGDFVTAPEICQIFGELIGLWAVMVWQTMGRPHPFALVELGPGRGTLLADALRASRVMPAFREAAQVHLVEISPLLREMQNVALDGVDPCWHDTLKGVPDLPAIVIANEFFDALPVRQLVFTAGTWRERCVGIDGELLFTTGAPAADAAALNLDTNVHEGTVFEFQPAALPVIEELGQRAHTRPLAALIIDYGHTGGYGDTLQAMRHHKYTNPLHEPGSADLTTHVDFTALGREAYRQGLIASQPLPQGLFLAQLGILQRWERLAANATPEQAHQLSTGVHRLTSPGGMGELFKVLAITGGGLSLPEPFQEMRNE